MLMIGNHEKPIFNELQIMTLAIIHIFCIHNIYKHLIFVQMYYVTVDGNIPKTFILNKNYYILVFIFKIYMFAVQWHTGSSLAPQQIVAHFIRFGLLSGRFRVFEISTVSIITNHLV